MVADELLPEPRDGAVGGRRPPAFGSAPDHDHRAPVGGVPVFHGVQRGEDRGVIVAVRQREHVPAVGGPLLLDGVGIQPGGHHAALQPVVDAGVVVRQQDAQALAHLLGDGLGLELLGMAGGHGELALQGHHLQRRRGAGEVPERGLAGGGADADAGGAAVDVVGQVGGLGVAGEGADAAQAGLGEARVVGQPVVGQQGGQRAGAAAEAEAVDRQQGHCGVCVVTVVAGGGVAPGERFAHDHPQRVGGGDVVAPGQQEAVGIGMLGAPVVVAQAAGLGAGQVQGDVVGGVGEGAPEVAGLGVVSQQSERHGGHEADLLEALRVVGRNRHLAFGGRVRRLPRANSDRQGSVRSWHGCVLLNIVLAAAPRRGVGRPPR